VGFFQKDLSNFFTTTTLPGTPELLDQYGVIAAAGDAIAYDLVTRGNGGDARVRGMEFTYRQSLTFLPNWARGVQVFINYTRSTLGGTTTADFTGFNPQTLSWGVNFVRPRYNVKFSSTEGKETKRAAVAANATTPAGSYQWQGALKRYTLSLSTASAAVLGSTPRRATSTPRVVTSSFRRCMPRAHRTTCGPFASPSGGRAPSSESGASSSLS
jgi:hypothetical protein